MQNLHFQTSLLLGVAFKSVHNLTPPPPQKKRSEIQYYSYVYMWKKHIGH